MVACQTLLKHIVPAYIFDGVTPDVKCNTRAKRSTILQSEGKDLLDLLVQAINKLDIDITEKDASEATIACMKHILIR